MTYTGTRTKYMGAQRHTHIHTLQKRTYEKVQTHTPEQWGQQYRHLVSDVYPLSFGIKEIFSMKKECHGSYIDAAQVPVATCTLELLVYEQCMYVPVVTCGYGYGYGYGYGWAYFPCTLKLLVYGQWFAWWRPQEHTLWPLHHIHIGTETNTRTHMRTSQTHTYKNVYMFVRPSSCGQDVHAILGSPKWLRRCVCACSARFRYMDMLCWALMLFVHGKTVYNFQQAYVNTWQRCCKAQSHLVIKKTSCNCQMMYCCTRDKATHDPPVCMYLCMHVCARASAYR